MDADRIITLLQAAISEGGLASEVQRTIGQRVIDLLEIDGMAPQIAANAAARVGPHVDQLANMPNATALDPRMIARALVLAYWDGMTLGMAVVSLAEDA